MSAEKPRRLGRGLEALIPGAASPTIAPITTAPSNDMQRVPLSRIRPNPFQPRREFDPVELGELEASLKASGLLQPISVRRRGDAYELIAGERRVRAATNLGWTEISAIVREFDDQTMLVLALVENLQRANLNAIDEARGYRRLIDEFGLTQQQVADVVAKDRTTVTNLLRVLSLPATVQRMVETGTLSAGHAKALLALAAGRSAEELAKTAVERGMSVRELEQLVREVSVTRQSTAADATKSSPALGGPRRVEPSRAADPAVRRLEDDLRKYLQTDVRIQLSSESRGKIEVAFYSGDDLERVLELILRERRADF
ncbi:MAG TPA: ParB/RepB/Spo0J family partition protein [Gemmatimonadaceae bacterium]|nr:ParB/RepB/Spo0J family partition protein [Gemmatimonadaceae bacterium]